MLRLTSHSLRGLAHKLESGPSRTIAISAVAGAVGLAAGKLEDARKTPLVAVGAGAVLKLVGLHTLGDGAMSGGATILGYRIGARSAKRAERREQRSLPGTPVVHERTAQVIPGQPTVRRAHPHQHGHHQRT